MGIMNYLRKQNAKEELGEKDYEKVVSIVKSYLEQTELGKKSDGLNMEYYLYHDVLQMKKRIGSLSTYAAANGGLALGLTLSTSLGYLDPTTMLIVGIAAVGGASIMTIMRLLKDKKLLNMIKSSLVDMIRLKMDKNVEFNMKALEDYKVGFDELFLLMAGEKPSDELEAKLMMLKSGTNIDGIQMSNGTANTCINEALDKYTEDYLEAK